MGGTWWSEDFAGEAIFQLDCLAVDYHLLRPGRRPVARAAISHILGRAKREKDKRILGLKQMTVQCFTGATYFSIVLCM